MDSTFINTTSGSQLIIDDLTHRGEHFEIARGHRANNTAELALRSLRIDRGWPQKIQSSIHKLRQPEQQAATLLLHTEVPMESVQEAEDKYLSLIIHPYIKGITLTEYIRNNHPQGAPIQTGLHLARQIAQGLEKLHEQRLVHRAPSPEHIIISDEETTDERRATLIGYGNVAKRQARPAPWQLGGDERYVAPEVVRERSGTFIHPRADIYTFGATLSYIFSGIHPTDKPEAPIANDAWRILVERPEGLKLLIAHCMQPFHKNRLINASKLLPHLHTDSLPDRKTDGFGAIALLAPWSGALEGKASSLSPGPLTTREQKPPPEEPSSEPPEQQTSDNLQQPQKTPLDSTPEPAEPHRFPEDSATTQEQAIGVQATGIRKHRLLLGMGMIALAIIGGAMLRLCS